MHIISRDPAPPPIDYVQALGRNVSRHDDSRLRHGALSDRRRGGRGLRGGRRDGRSGDRQGWATGYGAGGHLRFRSGAIGTIDNSRKAVFGYDQRVEILGTEGKIATENRYPNQVIVSTREICLQRSAVELFHGALHRQFRARSSGVYAGGAGRQTRPVTGDDSRVPVVMAMAARKSFDEHRPVKLDGGGSMKRSS